MSESLNQPVGGAVAELNQPPISDIDMAPFEAQFASSPVDFEAHLGATAFETEVQLESEPAPEADNAASLEQARLKHLYSLDHAGFVSAEIYEDTLGKIAATGLPTGNITAFISRPNSKGRENVLASMGIGDLNLGHFTAYDLVMEQHESKQLGTYVHETQHSLTPFETANAHYYGGKENLEDAAEFVKTAAQQSLDTNKWLNGYHALLAKQLRTGKINRDLFDEETSAIATELAMTDRAHLKQVETAQRNSIERRNRDRRNRGLEELKFTPLMSSLDENGNLVAAGIDTSLVHLVEGVDNIDGLMKHIDGLKARFYPDESLKVAEDRAQKAVIESEIEKAHQLMMAQIMAHLAMQEYGRITDSHDFGFTKEDDKKIKKKQFN